VDLDERLSGLMRRAQDGDGRSYEDLLLQVSALARSFARARVAGPDLVEEIVQETLFSIHRDRHTWDPSLAFLPWFHAVVRHRWLDVLARERRRHRVEVPVDPSMDEPASDPALVLEAIRSLRRALALLSIRQQEIIQMLKLDGFSVAEISRRTGLSESSVKVTAHRGYKRLRQLLEGTHGY
jgi:RNA polymerase sigma-70 factor (ECF subfamily)